MKFLIHESECDVNASNSEFKQPLHVACIQGSEEVVSLLLESGSDVNSLKRNRWTALMHASSHGHASVVKLLIEKGARVEESNREGATALYIAARSGSLKCVETLLNQGGANIDTRQRNLRTPMHVAIMNSHDQVLQLLLKSGAKEDVKDRAGMSLLHECAYAGVIKCAKMLTTSSYTNDMLYDEWGRHPLHAASMRGHVDFVNFMLSEFDDNIVDIPCKLMGANALFYACSEGHATVVKLLLSKGASCNAQTSDEHMRTSLHAAASWGRLDCVRTLLQNGARTDMKDAHGVSALDMAIDRGHDKVVELFR